MHVECASASEVAKGNCQMNQASIMVKWHVYGEAERALEPESKVACVYLVVNVQ